jgi:hypothetical protein
MVTGQLPPPPVVFWLLAKLAELWPSEACLPKGQGPWNLRRKSATKERRSRFCGPQAPGGTTGAGQAGAATYNPKDSSQKTS